MQENNGSEDEMIRKILESGFKKYGDHTKG